MVFLSAIRVLDPFFLITAIQGMGNVLQNSSILEASGSTHTRRSGLSKTSRTDRGVYLSVYIYDVHVYDTLHNDAS